MCTVKGVLLLVAAALLLATASTASASTNVKLYAFPSSWVAKERASLVSSTGNTNVNCHGESRVFMRAGGFGFIRIICQGSGTTYTFGIGPTGRVHVSATA